MIVCFLMNTHETLPSPELDMPYSTAVFEAVSAIDLERNPAFTALEQIKGAEVAKLFLRGYADKMAAGAPDMFADGQPTPLDVAAANMRYIAGYYISGEDASKQLREMLEPWQVAYEALNQEA